MNCLIKYKALSATVSVAVVGACIACLHCARAAADEKDPTAAEFFERKIRPVLAEHCYECHSAQTKKAKGGLRLDTREGIRKGGELGPAVVPGNVDESLLMEAIRYEGLKMPPRGKLPTAVVADFEQWIKNGAADPRENAAAAQQPTVKPSDGDAVWAFQSPKKHDPPAVKNAAWPQGDVDRFILAKLEANNMRPSVDAERATLLRRVYFDLIGLPPSPQELDAFVNDNESGALERVVDRLLESPQFGERWGRHWLDVARFAETSGGGRSLMFPDAWRYRDYVIEAFNSDRPYDQFIREQIAGDLLAHSTPAERERQLVATAFLMLGPTNYERQDKDILEMDVIDEQLDTMGKAILGLTVGCARCHDHKFDPIPTRDYYAMAGIMKSTRTLIHDNVSRWVEQPLPMEPALEATVKQHEGAVAAIKNQIKLAKDAEKKTTKPVAATSDRSPIVAAELPGIVVDDAQAKRVGSWKDSMFTNHFVGAGYVYDDRSQKGEKTLTFQPEFTKSGRYEVRLAYVPYANRATNTPVRIFHADGDQSVHVNQRETPPIDERFVSLGTFRFEEGSQWFVMLSTEGANGHVVGDAVQFIPEGEAAQAAASEKEPNKPAGDAAAPKAPDIKTLEVELKKLTESAPKRPMAMAPAEADKIGDISISIRGNFHTPGERAPRGFIRAATFGTPLDVPANESGRRELAAWLTSRDNPLTARVMVNRVWHHLFGVGLVRTTDNLGSVGERPSHPELLDYLAVRFMDDGWSVKRLVRLLVLSRVYQQSSEAAGSRQLAVGNEQTSSSDPENRLFGRQNRRRLEAEAIRDAILSVSGELDRSAGGPTIKAGTTKELGYVFDDSRRSVYTPVLRNRLLDLFEVFDFADPNIVLGRRNVSTVSTQALYLMNHPFVMDQAAAAARRTVTGDDPDDAARVDRAYRTALGRLPTPGERRTAVDFLRAASGSQAADDQHAAWAQLYQALFACIDFRYVD